MANLLVVDDMSIDRRLVAGILQRESSWKVECAESGELAIARLAKTPSIDLVITDLTMPVMDGLELVTLMQLHYPAVPVILVTANGSEELAVAALEQGATSYVPKLHLADKLRETVDRVLAHAHAQTAFERLTQSLDSADLKFTLGLDERMFQQLIELVQQLVASLRICEPAEEVRLGMALEEALREMLLRGCLELSAEEYQDVEMRRGRGLDVMLQRLDDSQFRDRRLHLEVCLSRQEARFIICHPGAVRPIADGPLTDEALSLDGPGAKPLVLMRSFLDEVLYADGGRQLTLVKRR